jgi:hypothetical protein
MAIAIPDGLSDLVVNGGILVFVLERVHAAWSRQRDRLKNLERRDAHAGLVTEDQCNALRSSCRGGVDCELEEGNRAFDQMEAYIRVLARRASVTSAEIEEELKMMRLNRKPKE